MCWLFNNVFNLVITNLLCLQELAGVQYKEFNERLLAVEPVVSQHSSTGWYYNGKVSC